MRIWDDTVLMRFRLGTHFIPKSFFVNNRPIVVSMKFFLLNLYFYFLWAFGYFVIWSNKFDSCRPVKLFYYFILLLLATTISYRQALSKRNLGPP